MTKDTIEKLKIISPFINKVRLGVGKTIFMNEGRSVVALIDTPEIKEEICIYDINKLINITKMFSEYELSLENDLIVIEGIQSRAEFKLANPELVEDFGGQGNPFENLSNQICSIPFSKEDLKSFKIFQSIEPLNEFLSLKSFDTSIEIESVQKNSDMWKNNSFKKKYLVGSDKKFDLKIKNEILNYLPQMDFNINIFYNPERDRFALVFENELLKVRVSLV